MKRLVLSYKRLREMVNGEYPYEGKIQVFTTNEVGYGDSGQEKRRFIQCTFKDIIKHLHVLLKEEPSISTVLFQRTEREDILPMQLSLELVNMLRSDPLSAYRAMSHTPDVNSPTVVRLLTQETTKVASEFGELLYLDVQNGYVLDPISGEWKGFAYGERHGWRINAGDNKPDGWLSIDLVDDAPDGTQFSLRMAFARWAVVRAAHLLSKKAENYFLPRPWNVKGPWISHDDLSWMLQQHQLRKEA